MFFNGIASIGWNLRRDLTKYNNGYFNKNERYFVACSGGVDSIVLLHTLSLLCIPIVLHVNYHLRGQESDEDEAFVTRFCLERGFELYVHDALYEEGNVQAWAREQRFGWFKKMLDENPKVRGVLLGHHLDDQLESFMMAKEAGKSAFQQAGMTLQNQKFVRPFLAYTKAELIQYAMVENLTWRDDSSNASAKYVRNETRLRLAALSKPKKTALLDEFEELNQRKHSAQVVAEQMYTGYVLDAINGMPLARPFLAESMDPEMMIPFFFPHITQGHVLQKIIAWAQTGKGIGQMEPAGEGMLLFATKNEIAAAAAISRRVFRMRKDKPENLPMHTYAVYKATLLPKAPELADLKDPDVNGFYIDFDKLPAEITVRPWQPGDRIKLAGKKAGTKTIGDYFTDQKLHPVYRHYAYVLADGDEVIFLSVGYVNPDYYTTPGKKTLRLKPALK